CTDALRGPKQRPYIATLGSPAPLRPSGVEKDKDGRGERKAVPAKRPEEVPLDHTPTPTEPVARDGRRLSLAPGRPVRDERRRRPGRHSEEQHRSAPAEGRKR